MANLDSEFFGLVFPGLQATQKNSRPKFTSRIVGSPLQFHFLEPKCFFHGDFLLTGETNWWPPQPVVLAVEIQPIPALSDLGALLCSMSVGCTQVRKLEKTMATLFLGSFRSFPSKTSGKVQALQRQFLWKNTSPESGDAVNHTGSVKGKPAAKLGSALPWGLLAPSLQGVFFGKESLQPSRVVQIFRSLCNNNKSSRSYNLHFQYIIVMAFPKKASVFGRFSSLP